jgi:hypothetical protein
LTHSGIRRHVFHFIHDLFGYRPDTYGSQLSGQPNDDQPAARKRHRDDP